MLYLMALIFAFEKSPRLYLVHRFPSADSKREWSNEVLFLPRGTWPVSPTAVTGNILLPHAQEDVLDIFRVEMALGWMLETAVCS